MFSLLAEAVGEVTKGKLTEVAAEAAVVAIVGGVVGTVAIRLTEKAMDAFESD